MDDMFCIGLCRTYDKHRDYANRVYASDEVREKAEKLMSGLESEYPAFIKSMLQSHVSGGFWLVIYYKTIILSTVFFFIVPSASSFIHDSPFLWRISNWIQLFLGSIVEWLWVHHWKESCAPFLGLKHLIKFLRIA